ncbi:hypothetical protein DLM86_23960 [Paenibacillus flagellatus]|uniref:Uncharacterized protein n=1 Tax=Paenibacillus flagellatus TaxID=2211139 RepID=A0A2V5JXB2_9BACL|nr:hypothetical protein DLM86_23960 [Paenibacillus flagellatus]
MGAVVGGALGWKSFRERDKDGDLQKECGEKERAFVERTQKSLRFRERNGAGVQRIPAPFFGGLR